MRKHDRHDRLFQKEFISQAEADETQTNRPIAKAQLQEVLENKNLAELDYKRSQVQVEAAFINKKLAGIKAQKGLRSCKTADYSESYKWRNGGEVFIR